MLSCIIQQCSANTSFSSWSSWKEKAGWHHVACHPLTWHTHTHTLATGPQENHRCYSASVHSACLEPVSLARFLQCHFSGFNSRNVSESLVSDWPLECRLTMTHEASAKGLRVVPSVAAFLCFEPGFKRPQRSRPTCVHWPSESVRGPLWQRPFLNFPGWKMTESSQFPRKPGHADDKPATAQRGIPATAARKGHGRQPISPRLLHGRMTLASNS